MKTKNPTMEEIQEAYVAALAEAKIRFVSDTLGYGKTLTPEVEYQEALLGLSDAATKH
jgi:uncharacterized protein YhbP (UPF0306 family)